MTTTPPTTGTRGPESLVTSLELSREMKEAGWPQDSTVFAWQMDGAEPFVSDRHKLSSIPCPTAEEILRELPDSIPSGKTSVPLLISFRAWSSKGFNIRYAHGLHLGDEQVCVVSGDTLANALAKMWLYLKKNNLLPPTKSYAMP